MENGGVIPYTAPLISAEMKNLIYVSAFEFVGKLDQLRGDLHKDEKAGDLITCVDEIRTIHKKYDETSKYLVEALSSNVSVSFKCVLHNEDNVYGLSESFIRN